MKTESIFTVIAVVCIAGSCAPKVPQELASAREAYRRASNEMTAYVAPAEVHVAKPALKRAERFDLSQRRADAVRSYLVQRGCEGRFIKANGLGEGYPIVDNNSVEGRADNRRVEIVIEREMHASNR